MYADPPIRITIVFSAYPHMKSSGIPISTSNSLPATAKVLHKIKKTMQQTQILPTIAEVEISYKSKVPASQRQKITSSADAEKIFRSFWPDTLYLREKFYIILLNRANQVLAFS